MTHRSSGARRAPPVATLRRRALDAARALLRTRGPDALHLRTIATEIGCGVASLYYHFADKDALLAALAAEGFRDLNARIKRTMDSGRFPHKIDAASAAYLTFIQRNLQLYALMYGERLLAGNEEARNAEQEAFVTFQGALTDDNRVPSDRIEEIALVCWVLGRGIASSMIAQGEVPAAEMQLRINKVLRGFVFLLSPSFVA